MVDVPKVDLMDIDREPTDEELKLLMTSALETIRDRSRRAQEILEQSIKTELENARARERLKGR